jgi:quercetin dioxygenase-like cupin family protein
MQLRKYRWSPVYEAAEETLSKQLQAKKIQTERWTAEPGQLFAAHAHTFDKRLWCAEGSIVLTIGDKTVSLQAGDALELPANTIHSAVAGMNGCACYEAHEAHEAHS